MTNRADPDRWWRHAELLAKARLIHRRRRLNRPRIGWWLH